MSKTFAFIHGAGDVGWSWHLVAERLRRRGHDVVAPDLPCDDDGADLDEYVATMERAIGACDNLVVVGQSFGGFTATLLAGRRTVEALVLVTAMIPEPGESAEDWFANTGWAAAVGGEDLADPFVAYYHDVPTPLAEEAMARERSQSSTPGKTPFPLGAWPDVPTRFVLCTEDRFFPPSFMRPVVAERLGITPDEIAAGHCAPLSRPDELAMILMDA